MNFFIKWIINAGAIILSAYFITGVQVDNFWTAIWLAAFLAIVNILLKPILIILTLPINIITLGLFTFVINAGLILLASSVIKGFFVVGFIPALIFAIVLSLVCFFLHRIFGTK